MRRERLRKLARFLDKLPKRNFDMGTFGSGHGCGTVACIAGWTPAITKDAKRHPHNPECVILKDGSTQPISTFAANWLDLTDRQANGLFYMEHGWSGLENATPKDAAKRIRRMLRTGR